MKKTRFFLILLLFVGLTACSHDLSKLTLAPKAVVTTQASFDGNQQNSGIISANDTGFLVTPHFLERYDALLTIYGKNLEPPVTPGDRRGVVAEAGNYRITGEVMEKFITMNQRKKAKQKPGG